MALGGFLGSAINRTLEAVLPKGSRGAVLGEALGIGAPLGSGISAAVSGLEEPLIAQLQAPPTRPTPTGLQQISRGPITQQDYLNMRRGRQLIQGGESGGAMGGASSFLDSLGTVLDITYPPPAQTGVTIGGTCDSAPAMKKIVTVRKTCDGVCVDVTRKQQSMMKKILTDNCSDPQYAVALLQDMIVRQTGIQLGAAEIMCLVNRRFKARPVSISNAQIRSARRMLNDVDRINKIAADVKKMAGGTTRRAPVRRKVHATSK